MNRVLVSLFLACCVLLPCAIWADYIPTEGEWSKTGLRSSIPAPPEANIDGNTLSIYFADVLTGVTLIIMDASGTPVHQEVISSYNSDYTYDVPWTGIPGNYQLLMTHASYGYMGGAFTIQ